MDKFYACLKIVQNGTKNQLKNSTEQINKAVNVWDNIKVIDIDTTYINIIIRTVK